MKSLIYITILLLCLKYTLAYYKLNNRTWNNFHPGSPLLLSDYIEKGQINEAKKQARVVHPALSKVESYSGYITIDKKYNSNTFFWFFPSQRNPRFDPVILWFIGGPGLTVLITVFDQSGPFMFTQEDVLEPRNYSLAVNHSVIYIDNPVGTGYSFTENVEGYAKNQSDITEDVLSFLKQFFKLFPEYWKNDFYVGGDSYGGKFVIETATAIQNSNRQTNSFINLKGLLLGNGLIEFETQRQTYDLYYALGIVDRQGRERLKEYQTSVYSMYDKDGEVKLLAELTGYNYFSNFLFNDMVYNTWYVDWLSTNEFRYALHAGNKDFNFSSDVVRTHFENPYHGSVRDKFENLLKQNYRVLVYNGQLDLLFSYVSSENLYMNLNWSNSRMYLDAPRKHWWLDGKLAGYVKSAVNFVEVLIRDAGHVTFFEQPKWTCELFTRFTHKQPIIQEQVPVFPVNLRSKQMFF